MSNENFPADQARAYFDEHLPKLNYWKRYAELGGDENFKKFKEQLIREFNDLHIEGMPEVKTLNFLVGGYINMEYSLPNGQKVKFLDDNTTYLANQLECEFGGNRCFGIAGNMDFLLVCTYEENGYVKERLGATVDRIGTDALEAAIVTDDLITRKDDILAKPLLERQ